jgi:hypothetical protein
MSGLEGIISKRADLPYRSGRGDHCLSDRRLGQIPRLPHRAGLAASLLQVNRPILGAGRRRCPNRLAKLAFGQYSEQEADCSP